MIKVTVLYPNSSGSRFDIGYYCEKHMPMVRKLVGSALKGMAVEHGIGGMAPGSPAPYAAMGHLVFDSVEAFQKAFGPHTQKILADVPNYTNIQPVVQIGEVKM